MQFTTQELATALYDLRELEHISCSQDLLDIGLEGNEEVISNNK